MCSLHIVNAFQGSHTTAYLFTLFISETVEQSSVKFGIVCLHKILVGEFNFGSYQSDIIPTLYQTQTEVYQFSQEQLILQNWYRHKIQIP
jgi:hypothetical protein